MKKKTLIILLIIPFLIGLLTFVSITVLNITMASDITDIKWNYNQNEGFKIQAEPYELSATPVINENVILADGNDLTWYVKNLDSSDETQYARIEENNDKFYLYALEEGETQVVCSNIRGTVSKFFTAHIFENGAVIINPVLKSSGSQIDSSHYYGEYDLAYDKVKLDGATKNQTKVEFSVDVYSDSTLSDEVMLLSASSNVAYDTSSNIMTIYESNDNTQDKVVDSYFTLASKTEDYLKGTYNFKVVVNGVNIYNYNDLLMTTNFSTSGEIVVMQTSLGSLRDVYNGIDVAIAGDYEVAKTNGYLRYEPSSNVKKDESLELFGNYDFNSNDINKFNFKNEVYTFETTYNHEYLDQLNVDSNTYKTTLKAAIHLQKDLYGNGYTINANDLCFPNYGSIDTGLKRLSPTSGIDLFEGPLALVSIGNPEKGAIVKAYGQDNVGLYIDGDNITINDLKMKNIDDNVNRANFTFSGTVVDVNGDNVTIKNSVLSNGKNIVRAFSSDNLKIDNCILKTSGEFNLYLGSNEYIKPDETQKVNINYGGSQSESDFRTFFSNSYSSSDSNFVADKLLTLLLNNDYSSENKDVLYDAIVQMQAYLDNKNGIIRGDETLYDSHIECNNVLFGDSGIFSIAFDTMFNGPFLYSGLPSQVRSLLLTLSSPAPQNIAGTSKPVELTLSGNNKFYDWKSADDIDIGCLIEFSLPESITSSEIKLDDFFPMKEELKNIGRNNGYIYESDGKQYINSKVAWYGGGLNYSNLISNDEDAFGDIIIVDLLENKFSKNNGDTGIVGMLGTCVMFAAGFNPFKFLTNDKINSGEKPDLFGEAPQIEDLLKNIN